MIKTLIYLIVVLKLALCDGDEWDFLSSSPTNTEYENICQLQVQSESFKTKKTEVLFAFAGNGFNYEIGCHINDPKMRPGDKYYIIDLILYGPNTRVAKAWREQFSTTSLMKARNLSLNKKVSFRWLGINSILCSVTKYNNLANKFTKLCQKSVKVNATEKIEDNISASNTVLKYILPSNNYLNQLNEMQAKSVLSFKQQRQLYETQPSAAQKNKEREEKKLSFLKNRFYETSTTSTNTQSLTQSTTSVETKEPASSLNMSAKAMQFRNLFEANSEVKKLVKVENKSMQVKGELDKPSSRMKILQPLTIISIFLVIFFVSIGTIVYLTYHQKTNDQYGSVKTSADVSDADMESNHTQQSISISRLRSFLNRIKMKSNVSEPEPND